MARFVPAWLQPAPDSIAATLRREGKSPWSDAVHVLWSAWIFITPAFSPAGYDARWLVVTVLSYPVFLLLFAMTLLAPPRQVPRYALGMVAMSLALLPWYLSGLSYFVFGCVMLSRGQPHSLLRHAAVLLALSAVLVGYAVWLGYPWQAVAWLPLVTLIVGSVVQVDCLNQRRDAALRLSQEEVRRLAATAERERIGRDLHDLLGHTLSLVALKSELAGKLVERDPTAARRELADVTRVAREALTQVRSAVTGIRAVGLASELASARLLLESDGVHFHYALAPVVLPPEVEAVLALTLREAATNIQRHARARRAEAALEVAGDAVVLRVEDDGRGGDIAPGNGLCGMRERIEALGGRLRVDAAPGRGTRIEAILPMPRPADGVRGDAPPAPAHAPGPGDAASSAAA
nr:sensor histidine kinase [Lysobacter tabacisoli]